MERKGAKVEPFVLLLLHVFTFRATFALFKSLFSLLRDFNMNLKVVSAFMS